MDTDSIWKIPPAALEAPAGVDVWRCPLDRDDLTHTEWAPLLDSGERARADGFVFEPDRRRWTVSRALLRQILARYVRRPPEELRFETNPWGKPSLRDHPSLAFNLSHSGPMMLVAVAEGRPVGIDLEQIRTNLAAEDIAGRFFTPRERAALAALPAALLPAAFFACWTRKESVVKALGQGVTLPLDTLEVGVEGDGGDHALRTLPVGPDFAATLAGAIEPLRFWRC